jgi:hypothetical protein
MGGDKKGDEEFEEFRAYGFRVALWVVGAVIGVLLHVVFWNLVSELPGETLWSKLDNLEVNPRYISAELIVVGILAAIYDILLVICGLIELYEMFLRFLFEYKKRREKREKEGEVEKEGYQAVETGSLANNYFY